MSAMPADKVQDLVESLLNGNYTHVVECVHSHTRAEAIYLAAAIAVQLECGSIGEKEFLGMLAEKVKP